MEVEAAAGADHGPQVSPPPFALYLFFGLARRHSLHTLPDCGQNATRTFAGGRCRRTDWDRRGSEEAAAA